IMKIGLFYGTTSAATQEVADLINDNLDEFEIEIFDIYKEPLEKMNDFDKIIIGCPTWDIGLLQEDWRNKFDDLDNIDFSGKQVAYFGCGDQQIYSATFLDALGILEEKITSKGGTTIGLWSTDGYAYDYSKAEKDGKFVGLAIDNDNEPELTEERVQGWCEQLKKDFS
ncbi:MAG: flavodoxin FldA, partial [Thermodesulfobacteriota bacterium]|nr:flavodoxin FldA [Thermodesulfobacteriota bacterium]